MFLAARRLGGHRDQVRSSFVTSSSRLRQPAHAKPRRRLSLGVSLLTLLIAGGVWAALPGESAWAGTVSLLPDNAVPRVLTRTAAHPTELGMRFRATAPSDAIGVQFYKGPRNTGKHTATLWSSSGRRLARVTFGHETRWGLQRAQFNRPVPLRAGERYVVSYTSSVGRYSLDERFFTRAISNSLLSAGRNAGVFSPRAGAFPSRTARAASYAVDIVVRPRRHWPHSTPTPSPTAVTTPAATTAPTTTASTPTTTPTTSAPTPTTASPTPSTTSTPTASPTTTTPTAAPGTCSAGTANTAGGSDQSGGCWPGPTNTGVPAGVKLKRVPEDATSATQAGGRNSGWTYDSATGSLRITSSGAVISGVDVRGGIVSSTAQSGMTVESSRFRCASIDGGNFCGALGNNSTMTDTEIGGGDNGTTFINSQGFWLGGSSANIVLTRVNIHHIVHGLHVDGGTTVVDSYLHDMPAGDRAGSDNGSAHTNCVFISTGGNTAFRHDTFNQCGNNSGIFVQNYANTAEGIFNLTVQHSLFFPTNRNGQKSSYGVGIENKDIKGANTIHVRDNVFAQGWEVGPIEAPTGADVGGNKYADGSTFGIQWR